VLSINEAKDLLRLCNLGKLFEVEEWIASGNSLCIPNDLKVTPLEVAVDTGFHSLVKLLVRAEPGSQLKNRALRRALSHKRLDLIELLVSHGAEISSVPFIEVLMLWDPAIIRYCLYHGADFLTGNPFAEAFVEKIRPRFVRGASVKKNIRTLVHNSRNRLTGLFDTSARRKI
jgi:hypothetical protein